MTEVSDAISSLKKTLASLAEAHEFVSLSVASHVKAAAYVFTDINIKWDPTDHPRDPHTGEFMESPSGYIFGQTKTAKFPLASGHEKNLTLKPGDVAFKTHAGNVIVSHADGTFSFHHGDQVDHIFAGAKSTIATGVMNGDLEKIGENPGVHINADTKTAAEDMLANPAAYGGTKAEPAATSMALGSHTVPDDFSLNAFPNTSVKSAGFGSGDVLAMVIGGIADHTGWKSKPTVQVGVLFQQNGSWKLHVPGVQTYNLGKGQGYFHVAKVGETDDYPKEAGDPAPSKNVKIANTDGNILAMFMGAKAPKQSIPVSEPKAKAPVHDKPLLNAPQDAPQAPADAAPPQGPSTPLEAAQQGAQSAWDVPKPTLKSGKSAFTAKQVETYQAATKDKVVAPDAQGNPIKSGGWVEFEGKPYQVWASPYGKATGKNSDFGITTYRWISTKHAASNLAKEDYFTLGDLATATAIPDPSGKPYVPIGQEAPIPAPDEPVAPKHGSLMAHAAVGAIPNTATAHKKHVADASGVLMTTAPDSLESVGHQYLTVKNQYGDEQAIKSGDWVEIDGKPVQVHASPNAGHIAIAKWIAAKKQVSNNTYDFPESVLSSATKISDPTGSPYVPLDKKANSPAAPATVDTPAADAPAPAGEAPDGSTVNRTSSSGMVIQYEKQDGKWVVQSSVTASGEDLTPQTHGLAVEPGTKVHDELESTYAADQESTVEPAPKLLDVLKQHVEEQKGSGEVTPDLPETATTNDPGPEGGPDTLEYALTHGELTEETMAALPAGTVVAAGTNEHDQTYLHKDAHDTWSIMDPAASEWPVVSDAEAATVLSQVVVEPWQEANVLPPDSDGAASIMNNPMHYPVQKQVTVDFETYKWQKDGWYDTYGTPAQGLDEALDDAYDTKKALADNINAMQPGDELHYTRKKTGKTTVYKADMVAGVLALENMSSPSLNATGMKHVGHFSNYVLTNKNADKFSFQILAKGESTEDATPKQQQFVHPVSGVVFPLMPGDEVYKHKTTDNAFIIVKGDGENPVNFFTQNGKQQKPKAHQKNLAHAYEQVDDWPGKVDEDKNGEVVQPDITPGQATTVAMIQNASPGDTIHLFNENDSSLHETYTKKADGFWDNNGDDYAQPFVEVYGAEPNESWTSQFYPNGTAPAEPENTETSPWGSPDASGTVQEDPEPITTAPEPKPKTAAAKKKAAAEKPALPTVVTDPSGNQITLKVGEAYAKVPGDHGEEVYVHVTQSAGNNPAWGLTSTSYAFDKKVYKWTPASLKSYIKANGGELIGEYPAPPAEKTDFSSYHATAFDESQGYSAVYHGITNYISGQKQKFPIDTYYSGGISHYKGFDQFDGKTWSQLDAQEKLDLVSQYEHIAGDAVASLEPVAKFDTLDKGDKQAFGKTRTGFTVVHRAAVLAREINNPDTDWSDDKFEIELAFVSSKTQKPGVSLGSDLKNAFPISEIAAALTSANKQRVFKKSLTGLDFDPFNGTTEEYDGYAKNKGFPYLAALTPAEQKAWVLTDLGDPTLSAGTKQQVLKAAVLVKNKIAVADLAAHLESQQIANGKPKVLASAKGIYAKTNLKASYAWTQNGKNFVVANTGDDTWQFADADGTSFAVTDAEVLNLVNGALDSGADMTSSPKSAYGSVTAKDNFDKLAIKHGVPVDGWGSIGYDKWEQIIGAEGGGPAANGSSYQKQAWVMAHAAGDEIMKYNIEKSANGGVHPNPDTHPGSPTSPTGKAAHKALAEILATTEGGVAWMNDAHVNSLNSQAETQLQDVLGLRHDDFVGTNYYDDWHWWSKFHDAADLKAALPGTSTGGGTTTVAVKPAGVSDESWAIVDGVDGSTDLSSLFGSDSGIGAMTDAELTAGLASDGSVTQSGLGPYIGSLPTHIKRLALWGAKGDSADAPRRGVLLAVAAKAKAGEYMGDDTPAWVAPNGSKYPMSPGAKVYQSSNYQGAYFIVTGPPKADGSASDQGLQFSEGSTVPQKVSAYVMNSLDSDNDYTLLYTMPAPVQLDQAKKDIPDLTDAFWNESGLIEEGKSTSFTHTESGPLLTAALKKNDTLKENYPHLYALHKSLPENVRQAVLAALTGPNASPMMLQLMDYKASKGHYASLGTAGLFDASQPWLTNVSKGQMSESDVASKWTPEAKNAYVAHFGLSGPGDISTHLNAALNPETPILSKGLPSWADLKLTKTGKSLGGMHTKHVFVDQDGNEWMSKAFNNDENGKARVDAETGAMRIGHLFGFRGPAVNTQAVPGYNYAYLQHLAPAKGDLTSKGPKDLSVKQLQQAMEEHVLDWLVSNHDTHKQNLMIDPNGNIFGIDKGQAFRFFPNDKLAVGYLPPSNPEAVWYDQFYYGLQNGTLDKETADEVTKHVLRRAQKIAKDRDEDYRAELETALANRLDKTWPSQYPTREAFINALVERKHNLFNDFVSFYKGMYAKSPYEWDIDEENLVPPKINEHTHIAVSHDLANDVIKAGIHGKALFFNSSDLTDSHIMFSKVIGPDKQPMLTGTARVREESEKNLMDWLKQQTIQGHTAVQTQSYDDYDSTTVNTIDGSHLPGNSAYFNAMVTGSKTVSSHNANGNQDYNQATLTKMDGALQQINAAQAALAAWKADNPQTPFKGVVPTMTGTEFASYDVELHTMEQQDHWESMLETYAGYATIVNDHKGSDLKISPHFQQVSYSPSKDALDLIAAKQAAGKQMSPFLPSKIEDILKKAKNGDDITVTKDGTTTVYTKAYGGWKSNDSFSGSSEDMASMIQGAKDASYAYSGTVPGLPDKSGVKSWANQQESGAELTLMNPEDKETYVFSKNADGLWEGAESTLSGKDVQDLGWVPLDAKTAEEAAEKSTTVKVGSKVLKVMYRKAASKAGELNDEGDLEMTNSEISNFDFGHMYEIDFGNTVIEYRPWEYSAGVGKAQKGLLKFRKKDWSEGDSDSLDEVLDVLRQIGLNLDPATEESMELFYWRHMTGTARDRAEGKSGGAWNGIVKDVDAARAQNPNMTAEEETQVIKDAWAKVIGQDKVDKAKWHPQFSRNRVQALADAGDSFTAGRPYWLRPDLTASELKALYGNKYVASSLYHNGDALKIATSGASMSSEERYRVLASGFKSGWSSEADVNHGSSGVVYTRQNRDVNWTSGHYKEYVYYHPRVSMRSHNYAFNTDSFGDESKKPHSSYDPKTMMKNSAGDNEMLVKYGVSVMDDIGFIVFHSATDRNKAIQTYKDRGITTINGLPIEQVFVTNRNDGKAVMDKLWADMIAEEKADA